MKPVSSRLEKRKQASEQMNGKVMRYQRSKKEKTIVKLSCIIRSVVRRGRLNERDIVCLFLLYTLPSLDRAFGLGL